MVNLALQGAKEFMAGALERVRLLRTALQQAALAATIPIAGIIITPALDRTLQRSQEVLLTPLQASVPASVCTPMRCKTWILGRGWDTLVCLRSVEAKY